MSTITLEIASQEFEKWIEEKRVSNKKREDLKEMEEEIIAAIQEGSLRFDSKSKQFIQTLKFPNDRMKELTFKTRIQVGVINARLKGIQQTDINGRLEAYVAVLTDESTAHIKTLDSSDFQLSSCIATYFL